MADAERDTHQEPDRDDEPSDERDAVDDAVAVDEVVRHPHHDGTTQREAVENALQDVGLSEAGEAIGGRDDSDEG